MEIKNRNKMSNVPNLRFREFEGEWEEKRLGELVENTAERISTSFLSVDNYISTENILQNFQGVIPATSIPHNINVVAFRKDDVLFSNIRPYLKKVWYASVDGGCSADVFVFRNNKICLPQFLYHSIANDKFINYAMSGTKGVKMPRGDRQQINQYPTYIPSYPEQEKITKFLSFLDDRISTQSQIIKELETLIKMLSKKLFFQELRFKDDNGNDFPDWEMCKLSDICSFYSGGTPQSTNNSYYNGSIPFIRSGEINSDKTELFISEAGLTNSSAKIINQGDLLIALYGATSGEIAISKMEGAINQAILCVKTIQNKEFLKFLWKIHKEQILSSFLQGGQGNLSAEIIKNLKFLFPKMEEQAKIANLLSVIEYKLTIEQKLLSEYQKQKTYFLNQMFI